MLLMFLFAGLLQAAAQQYRFTTFTVNDGLVHNNVRRIYQDKQGFLWIGTWEGLSRYDGHRFVNYTATDYLSNDFINDLFELPDGSPGMACNDGSVYRLSFAAGPQKMLAGTIVVNHIAPFQNKRLALTDLHGIAEWSNGALVPLSQPLPVRSYFAMAVFNDSLLVLQCDNMIRLLDKRLQLFAESATPKTTYIECGMLSDSKGRCWVGTTSGLRLLNKVQVKGAPVSFAGLPPAFRHPLLQTAEIKTILEDSDGNLWFGTGSGLICVRTDGKTSIITRENGLPAQDVTCLFMDREKNLWAGSSGGLAMLNAQTVPRLFTVDNGLLDNNILQLLRTGTGEVMAVTPKGGQLFSESTQSFMPAASSGLLTLSPQIGLKQNGTFSGYPLILLNKARAGFLSFSTPIVPGMHACRDAAGTYFSFGVGGVFVSRDLHNWKKILYHGDCRALTLDQAGRLWLGTYNSGLLRISYQYQNASLIVTEQKHFLPGIGIRSLFEDSKGAMWAGTRFDGVFRIAGNGNATQYSRKEGLTSNRITSIAENAKGAILLNYSNGIDKLVPAGQGYRVFNFSRLHNLFVNVQSVLPIGDTLWLGTSVGVLQLRDVETESVLPVETNITSALFGDSVHTLSKNSVITAGYRNNRVQFEFAAPQFLSRKQTLYSYRLLGSQREEWTRPATDYRVSFANLRPADYRFEVRSLGYNEQWGPPAAVSFRISPPFYLSWWFITLAALVAAGTVLFSLRRRILTVRHQAELKHRIVQAEMDALRAQMNPHFIFNCLNGIDSLIQSNEKEKATSYLAKFARLIRAILEASKTPVVPCWKDLETLQLYLDLESARWDNKIDCRLTVSPEISQGDYKVPPLVVQPYVENAIHHGLMNKKESDKKLYIDVRVKDNEIQYTIEDNGIGRRKAAAYRMINGTTHRSFGMDITQNRIALLKGNGQNKVEITDLYDEHNQPAGTRVQVNIVNQA